MTDTTIRDEKPVVQGICVDLVALQSIGHNCKPATCKNHHTCCSRYVPHVTPAKLETIVGCFPILARYSSSIIEGDGFKNVFEEWEDGSYRIDADADESCIFTYANASGEKLCALHSAALELGMPPVELKPSACSLWPLTLSAGDRPELSVDKNWKAFPCNRVSDNAHHLDAGVISIVADFFGEPFLEKLLEYQHQDLRAKGVA
jgi:hypothetical protein